MTFKDHFSKQAGDYAKFRPRYPAELFRFVAGVAPANRRVWDCATGNGQAALGLAEHFAEVIATDASAEQVARAMPHPRVQYKIATAESSGLEAGSVDLVTAATAAHWFDLPKFFAEATRVLRPGGAVAIWTYGSAEDTADPAVDKVLRRYSREIVGPYFPPELQRVWKGYKALDFPFSEIEAPEIRMAEEWNLEQVLGYLHSWSATQNYIAKNGSDPRDLILEELAAAWGDANRKITRAWKLDLRVGSRF